MFALIGMCRYVCFISPLLVKEQLWVLDFFLDYFRPSVNAALMSFVSRKDELNSF